jgi:hypothetical protein
MHIIQIDGGMPLEKKSCLTTVGKYSQLHDQKYFSFVLKDLKESNNIGVL